MGNFSVQHVFSKVKDIDLDGIRRLTLTRVLFLLFHGLVNISLFILTDQLVKLYGLSPNPAPLVVCIMDVVMLVMLVLERKYGISGRKSKLLLLLKRVILIGFFIVIIREVIYLGNGTSKDPFDVGDSSLEDHKLTFSEKLAYLALSILSLFVDCGALVVFWCFNFSLGPLLFVFSLVVNFVFGVLEIQIVISSIPETLKLRSDLILHLETFYVFVAAFTFSSSILGLSIVLTMTASNRISPLFRGIVWYSQLYFSILLIFILAAFGTSVYLLSEKGVEMILPIMFGIALFINILMLWSSTKLSLSIPQELVCEAIDIKGLKPYQKLAYAKLISSNPKNNPGVTGEQVMSLMETYAESKLTNLSCTVLRIYNPRKLDTFSTSDERDKIGEKLFSNDDNFFSDEKRQDSSCEVLEKLKPMSKNQRKRAMKKKKKNIELPVSDDLTEDDFEEQVRFHSQLKCTEALALFSLVEEYDVTTAIPGKLGASLSKLFGSQSLTKLLCIRIGLLAFHWPFRHSIFYCCSAKNIGLRNALVMKSIAKYDRQQKKLCTVIIDPMYSSATTDRSIYLSKWSGITLPSTNIVDLRPYRKKSSHDFFKSVKYRTHFESFKSAGGEVYEVKEYSESDCMKAADLWSNIALNRKEGGYNGYFANPDTKFFETLLTHDNNGGRSLLFLKVEDTVVASCVIFRLGETITSDLQGLDYEKSRHYKAYFVMMEAVINLAMNEGIDFVDFGPSTDEAKRSIGSLAVNIIGGLYTPVPYLSEVVKYAAKKVSI